MKTVIAAIFMCLLGAAALSAQEKVVVGGSGGLADEMDELGKAYMAKHPGDKIEVVKETMGSSGGVAALLTGRLTIGLVTSAPKGEEKAKLVYRVVGRSPVGIGVHKSLSVAGITEAQICDIFSGKIKSWKEVGGEEAKITVLTRKQNDANTEAAREKLACFKDVKFSAESIALLKGSEVLDALNRRPGTIGIISATFNPVDRPEVKTLAVNGVAPSPEAVRAGKYKIYNERGIVTLGAPQGAAKRFLDFVATADGQKILVHRGVIPVM
jgi:phosphate transport system substrate-binding protein